MKVLWLCNIPLPFFYKALNLHLSLTGGWLSGLLKQLKHNKDLQITVCFPLKGINSPITGKTDNLNFFAFPTHQKKYSLYFSSLLTEQSPDVIHIWGTEMPHSLAMIDSCKKQGFLEKIVINIQGLVSICAKHYLTGLPHYLNYIWTPKELLQLRNIYFTKQNFQLRGKDEIKAIQSVKHVIGRTDWDRACSTQMNPDIQYHFCNEILRDSFYEYEWDYNKVQKHSIFISQASYPIKACTLSLRPCQQL